MDVRLVLLCALVLRSVVCQDCVTVDFEEEFNSTFTNEIGACIGRYMWNLGHYDNIPIDSPDPQSLKYVYPNEELSCVSSFSFMMAATGVVEVNMFIEPADPTDQVTILVSQVVPGGNDAVVGNRWIMAMDEDFVSGWRTERITLSGFGNYNGYISLLGMAVPGSIVLVDSFRYIPPGTNDDDCVIYEIDIPSTITTRADIVSTQENTDNTDSPIDISSTTLPDNELTTHESETPIPSSPATSETEDLSTTQTSPITSETEGSTSTLTSPMTSETEGVTTVQTSESDGSTLVQTTPTSTEAETSMTTHSSPLTSETEGSTSTQTIPETSETDGSTSAQISTITNESEGTTSAQTSPITNETEESTLTQTTPVTSETDVPTSAQTTPITSETDVPTSAQTTPITSETDVPTSAQTTPITSETVVPTSAQTTPITSETDVPTSAQTTLITSETSAQTTPITAESESTTDFFNPDPTTVSEIPNTSLTTLSDSTVDSTATTSEIGLEPSPTEGPSINPERPVFWNAYTITMVILLILLIIIIIATVSYLIGWRKRRRMSEKSLIRLEFEELPRPIMIPRVQKATSEFKIPSL